MLTQCQYRRLRALLKNYCYSPLASIIKLKHHQPYHQTPKEEARAERKWQKKCGVVGFSRSDGFIPADLRRSKRALLFPTAVLQSQGLGQHEGQEKHNTISLASAILTCNGLATLHGSLPERHRIGLCWVFSSWWPDRTKSPDLETHSMNTFDLTWCFSLWCLSGALSEYIHTMHTTS